VERPAEDRRSLAPREGEPEPEPVQTPVRVVPRAETTCPLCLEALVAQPRLDVCPTCKTIQHATCVAEFGRCATIGCAGLAAKERTPAADDSIERRLARRAGDESTPARGDRRPARRADELTEQFMNALDLRHAAFDPAPRPAPPSISDRLRRAEHRAVVERMVGRAITVGVTLLVLALMLVAMLYCL
jgi:hypothetical protein